MLSPGEELLDLCAQTKKDVVLVAPFVKSAALKRVLDVIPTEATIRCVARWRPEEIAAGACDVEIFDLIKKRPHARLFIHPLLHAKFFRVDDRCLLGSANLTQRALGWTTPANLELILETSAQIPDLKRFEQRLFSTAFEASEELRDDMATAAEDLRSKGVPARLLSEESISNDEAAFFSALGWLPLCTRPDLLYQIYTGKNTDSILKATLDMGQKDLNFLRIPSGLSHGSFHEFVATSIQQTPVTQRIYEATARKPITPQDGQDIISSGAYIREYSLDQHWNTVRKWLLHFLPRVYRQPYGSNDLQRGAKIGEWQI